MTFLYILIIVVSALLALVVLAQNPKGGGLAQGFTGAQQIGGVQRTADFLEKSTWTLAAALMVLCLVGGATRTSAETDTLDQPIPEAAAPATTPLAPPTGATPDSGAGQVTIPPGAPAN